MAFSIRFVIEGSEPGLNHGSYEEKILGRLSRLHQYSFPDRWIVRMMANQIEVLPQVKTFLDVKDIKSGDSIPGVIRKSIKKCNEFVVLLSKNSIDRPWVLVEIGAAWLAEKRITAIIEKISPVDLPNVISQNKALDLNEFEWYLEQLRDRIKAFKVKK